MMLTKEQLQKMIKDEVSAAMPTQAAPVVYQSLEKVPEYGKSTISKLVGKGALKGTGQGLGLTTDMLRVLTVLDRLGKLD